MTQQSFSWENNIIGNISPIKKEAPVWAELSKIVEDQSLKCDDEEKNKQQRRHEIEAWKNKVDFSQVISDVSIFGELRQMSIEDLIRVPEIINTETNLKVKEIGNIIYDDKVLKIINVFIYYCIKVSNNVVLDGIQAYYHKMLRQIYVRVGMKIDIGRSAKICGKVLNLGARECGHIIYYLVYGRLATDCYIDAVTNQKLFQSTRTSSNNSKKPIASQLSNLTTKKQMETRKTKNQNISPQVHRKGSRSNTLLNQFKAKQNTKQQSKLKAQNTKNQIEMLAEDLSNIFSPNMSYAKGKKWDLQFSSDQININQGDEKQNWGWEGSKEQKKYYLSFYPNKVCNNQKSAFMQSFFHQPKNSYKFMRRRKFDHSVVEKMIQKTYLQPQEISINEKGLKNTEIQKRDKRFLINSNINKANDQFKMQGSELDKIRLNLKEKSSVKKKKSYIANFMHTDNEYLYNRMMKKRKNEEVSENRKVNQTFAEEVKDKYQEENCFINLLRKKNSRSNNIGGQKKKTAGKRVSDEVVQNNGKTVNQSGKKNFLSPSRSRFFQYKTEYRKFIKRHIFNE